MSASSRPRARAVGGPRVEPPGDRGIRPALTYPPQPGSGPYDPRPGDAYDPRPGDAYANRPTDAYGNPTDAYGQQGGQFGGQPGQYGGQQGQYEAQESGRSGPRLFPFPHWSTRTRNGTSVSVGGCCLPLPIGCLATTLTVGAVAASRVYRHVRR